MENEIKQCPYCGEEILAIAKKCKFCGEFLEEAESNSYTYDNQNNDTSELPIELQKFNWGAFLLNWIWGVGNRSYLTLWSLAAGLLGLLIPLFGWIIQLALSIWFGVKGNEWAWKNNRWKSIYEFNRIQRLWVKWGLGLLGIALLCFIGVIMCASSM